MAKFVILMILGLVAFEGGESTQGVPQMAVLVKAGSPIYLSQTEPNLNRAGLLPSGKADLICVAGTWVFYEYANFNYNSSGTVVFVFSPVMGCVDISKAPLTFYSGRSMGSPTNSVAESVNLFSGIDFQGNQTVLSSKIQVPYVGASIIVTGPSSWTISIQAPKVKTPVVACIGRNPYGYGFDDIPVFFSNLLSEQNVSANSTIKITAKGCKAGVPKFWYQEYIPGSALSNKQFMV